MVLCKTEKKFRLFDDTGEGFITVARFRVGLYYLFMNINKLNLLQIILKEIDEEFTEDELDEIIAEVKSI